MDYKDYMLQKDNFREEIIITQHNQCITLGKNSTNNELLKETNIPIYYSNRGGRATYHDVGQMLIYPHINLKKHNLTITAYINKLISWIKNTMLEFNIISDDVDEPGIWINNAKIAFVGIAIKNGCTQHGIAINLNDCDIINFDLIIPCNKIQKIKKLHISFEDFAQKLISISPFDAKIKYLPLRESMQK